MKTSTSTTHERIIDLVSGMLKVPSYKINPYTSLRDDLHLDAVDMLLLIAALENNFQVYLTAEEADAIDTIEDASSFLQRKAA